MKVEPKPSVQTVRVVTTLGQNTKPLRSDEALSELDGHYQKVVKAQLPTAQLVPQKELGLAFQLKRCKFRDTLVNRLKVKEERHLATIRSTVQFTERQVAKIKLQLEEKKHPMLSKGHRTVPIIVTENVKIKTFTCFFPTFMVLCQIIPIV